MSNLKDVVNRKAKALKVLEKVHELEELLDGIPLQNLPEIKVYARRIIADIDRAWEIEQRTNKRG